MTRSKILLVGKKLAQRIAQIALEAKAEDIVILDMRMHVNFCDYFLLCSGLSTVHLKAIAERIDEDLTKLGVSVQRYQGSVDSAWLLFDFGDVIVHILTEDRRQFYQLEYLWRDAKRISLK